MANWAPLRERLASVETDLTLGWDELDRLVGGLPSSAYDHPAFWSGQRPSWAGFSTRDVRVGRSVTFVRRGAPRSSREAVAEPLSVEAASGRPADAVLVGCVKQKLDRAAPARDLYTSTLFAKERAYAESSGAPWFVLSARHGLVAPDAVLEPYDLRLSDTSKDYRRAWGFGVAADLFTAMGSLRGARVEVHAGESYVGAIREPLGSLGAVLVEPLAGLSMGERLAWYTNPVDSAPPPAASAGVSELVTLLRDEAAALTPSQLAATGGVGLKSPGLYSWWVDAAGATDLTAGLGHAVQSGLIYAGLAGATRSKSGTASSNTLWGRLHGMHLGKRHSFSTFRRSLGSVLTERWGATSIDEERLTAWMHAHLRVVAVPVDDPHTLDAVETAVLAELDPPLNLSKMAPTPLRRRLTELRRAHSK